MSLASLGLFAALVIFSISVFFFVNRAESIAWQGRQSEAAHSAAGTVSGFIQRVHDALIIVSVFESDPLAADSDELNSLIMENPALLEIIRTDSSGIVFANASRDKSVLSNLITIPQSQWFLQARQGQTYVGDVQLSANNKPYLIMAVPSADGGVVAARVEMDVLWDVVKNIRFGSSGEVVVVTRAGNIIAHTNPEFAVLRQTLLGRPELSAMLNAPKNEWSGSYLNFHNEQVVAASISVPGTNWIVITELSRFEAFTNSRHAVLALGIEALILLVGVILIMARFVQSLIANPMKQLQEGAARIGQGDLNHRITMIRRDEIGELASSFNAMAADLEKQKDNLQAAMAYEYEVKRANELARSNAMNLALSRVAALMGTGSNLEPILETLGSELKKLDLSCAVATIDPLGEAATLIYVSFNPKVIQKLEKLVGFSIKNYVVPKRYWPGDRILKEKVPIWFPSPREIIRGMFPLLPDFISNQVWQMLGIESAGQICILPLLVDEKVVGALPIWGADLRSEDNTVLLLFASQVAGILQKARQHEAERQLNLTLARSKAFTSALSAIAAAFSQRQDKQRIFDILGMELGNLGLGYLIVSLSEDHQSAFVENISTPSEILSAIQRFTGVNLKGYVIDRKYWGALAEEYFYQGRYLFSDNPIEFTSLVIPKISSGLLKKALEQSMGRIEQKAIYLPLITDKKAYGILGIWGVDLQEEDAPALSVFASQVAGMLQNVVSFENETRRSNELARSNSMILSLSKVAAHLESSSQTVEIFKTVGRELKSIGIDSMVGLFDDGKQNLQIQYVSVKQDVIRWAEKMTGHTLNELSIPRRLWPTEKVVTEKSAYWDPNLMKGTLNMFPIIPERLHKTALKMAGINLDDPVCYLPLANEYDVSGVLAVWGAGLKPNDISALSILANQLTTAIRKNRLFEIESQRARELDILLKASEATSSSLELDTVLLTLAAQILELSGFESCNISEWDKETNLVYNRAEFARVYWKEGNRDFYSLGDYPRSKEVLITGNPIILQGDFEAEEKKWMDELGRTAVILLGLKAQEKIIGLVEIATTKKNGLFETQVLQECQQILANAANSLVEPLTANDTQCLFEIETQLIKAAQAEVCSFSEWDQKEDSIFAVVVSSEITWENSLGTRYDPKKDSSWKLALQEGKASVIVRPEGDPAPIVNARDGSVSTNVEALVIFPLQKGEEPIGLIELYDFNSKTQLSSEQVTLLRTLADKASYWIENARLLQQTQKRLEEQTRLLVEKEVMLKEIHHRVKNNLQIISSLLNLQADRISDPQSLVAYQDSQTRVHSMALIHEKLYQSQSLLKIDFGEYIESLTRDLLRTYQHTVGNIQLSMQVASVALDLDYAIPCGLILNELVTNALKYAFPNGRIGMITVELHAHHDQTLSLKVTDDGVGLPADLDILDSKTLGLQLVNSLAVQLAGKLQVDRLNGTSIMISFKY